jgi:hypothetical protein
MCHFYIGRRPRELSLASKEGTEVVRLLDETHVHNDPPELFVARERAAVDAWLGLSLEPE